MISQCIFCHGDATNSRSIEHIIPESLGNIEHTLPSGIVCDRCNNYFARKIEGPLLETGYFRYMRSLMAIENKRGRILPMNGVMPHLKMPVNVWMDSNAILLEAKDSGRADELRRSLFELPTGALFVPIPDKKQLNPHLMSRFIGKVAVEALAQRVMQVENWREDLLSNEGLCLLRRFVRIGEKPREWQFHRRDLYKYDHHFSDTNNVFEVLHEYDLIYTAKQELFFVMAIFGEEFAINMVGPEILPYENYLQETDGMSPLYANREK